MNQLTVKFLIGDALGVEEAQRLISTVAFSEKFSQQYVCQIVTDRLSFDILTGVDAVVCPGNTFGIMSGGLDKAIADLLPHVDVCVKAKVAARPVGEVPVGSCVRCSPMDYASPDLPGKGTRLPTVLYVPTMRLPAPLQAGTDVPYQAMAATLFAVQERNYRGSRGGISSFLVPLFGAGTGSIPAQVVLKQMLLAMNLTVQSNEGNNNVHELARKRNALIAQTWFS